MTDPEDGRESLMMRLQRLEEECASIKCALQSTSVPPLPGNRDLLEGNEVMACPESLECQEVKKSSPPPCPTSVPVESKPIRTPVNPWSMEKWLAALGAVLTLLGLCFLFLHAVEQGWLAPWVRISFGVLLGALFYGVGTQISRLPGWFKSILTGSAFAVWFCTVFAAHAWYNLIPATEALAVVLVVAVCAAALARGSRFKGVLVLSAAGGLLAPLFLSEGNFSGFEMLFLAGLGLTGAWVYQKVQATGWVWIWFFLGAAVLLQGADRSMDYGARWVLQGGWLIWGLTLIGSTAWKWLMSFRSDTPEQADASAGHGAMIFSMATVPFVMFLTGSAVWDLPERDAGWVALLLAVMGWLMIWRLQNVNRNPTDARVRMVLRFHGILFGLAALVMILDGTSQFLTTAAVAWVLIQRGTLHKLGWMRWLGYGLMAWTVLWLAVRILDASPPLSWSWPLAGDRAADLLVTALIMSQALLPWRRESGGTLHWIIGVCMLLPALAKAAQLFPHAEPLTTAMWTVFGLMCWVAGRLLSRTLFLRTFVVLMPLILTKLFLFDMSSVDTLWRVLLFLGMGGAILGVSLWIASRPAAQSKKESIPSEL